MWRRYGIDYLTMAVEAKDCGEVYIYVEHSVSPPNVINDANLVTGACLDDGEKADDEGDNEEDDIDEEESDGENREEESDEEERDEECQKEDQEEEVAEDENQILPEGAADTRFADLFAEAEQQTTTVHGVATQPNIDDENGYDSEIEAEVHLPPGEYPGSAEDTDEEWTNWHKKDDYGRSLKGKSKAGYGKPPYLWLMQTFSNGDEFKDQLLMYVLKTQFDVKLNKWHPERLAAICTHEKCNWRIYCSIEKPIRKWMVKVYEEKHNHLPT
ncbi:PREDICTED: putative uncharacterized transmembrane protein DDB_G0290641 [Camelina sativa]|uniref:Uncharacterized transmembrane protein DDB_G0290641 n=1 Tax=Camelina sativa TaxID=90675 RepID=A0ABM1QAZ0_CAMSA|nr:PREDICTED: putative uncharacterized transmembrane protein DDB_G0290641 [Camelina sativa]